MADRTPESAPEHSPDDEFADLFSRLPSPQSRTASQRAAESDPAPSGRRGARGRTATPVLDGDQGPEDPDERKSRIARRTTLVIVLIVIGGLIGGGAYGWAVYGERIRAVLGWDGPKDYEPGMEGAEVHVVVVPGDTGESISTTLHEEGVTRTEKAFYDHLIDTGQNPEFQPGVYALREKMTSAAALEALLDPANRRESTVQLREGLTVAQSLSRISDATGLDLADLEAAVADPSTYGVEAASLEGWLFPATYEFEPGTAAEDIVRTLVDRAVESLDAAGVAVADRQRVLTIASIIQREARYEADFYKVSRVIVNRMAPSNTETFGKLEMDSTAQYGYGEMHDGTASTSEEAQFDDNPWNTYVHEGLPVGPISNPGDLAIDAALHPADGPWLYFVTVNLETGETVFTATYEEHLKAVEQWRAWCEANDSEDC